MPRYHKCQMGVPHVTWGQRGRKQNKTPSGRHKLAVDKDITEDMRREPWGKSIVGAKLRSRGWGGVGGTPTRLGNLHTCAPSSKALPP